MQLSSSNELGVSASICANGEPLNRNPEYALAQVYHEILKLDIAQIFVCVSHAFSKEVC
ncbi:MAG: hypothetical protein AMXMBFR4_30120 [Candidatus Hydrogenedentota bacterium]